MKIHDIELTEWITKLNDMDRILLNRIEYLEKQIEQLKGDKNETN